MRDFKVEHPDFETFMGNGATKGMVAEDLGADGKPVYTGLCEEGSADPSCPNGGQTTSEANFNQWYNDVSGVNQSTVVTLDFIQSRGVCTYVTNSFFPIDGQLWGNEGNSHNYHFTFEFHTQFIYQEGDVFSFSGDDDVWVFINGKLAVDIGGLHESVSDQVDLDAQAAYLGIEPGGTYTLDFFFAERHTTESNFRIDTNIVFIDCFGNPVLGDNCEPECTVPVDWRGTACDTCSQETQSDRAACAEYLDCFAQNQCSPATCGSPNDICGVNTLGNGNAPRDIAWAVHECFCG